MSPGPLRILVFLQGWYGERIVRHIRSLRPDWEIWSVSIGKGFPRLPEGPEVDYLTKRILSLIPDDALEPDIALFLLEETGACLLIPVLAGKVRAKAVLCPVDAYEVLPRGLERQLSEELLEIGICSSFPRPFCSLSHGPGPIGIFARWFGRPEVEIEVEGGTVKAIKVIRGAPCGSTHHLAGKLKGAPIDEVARLAGLYVQTYPCLASHVRDPLLGEDMIGLSARLARAAFEKSISKALGLGGQPCR